MESKIKELFNDPRTVYIFDVDGVLARIEYADYNHYKFNDEEWAVMIENHDYYNDSKPFKTMQDFIENRNLDNIYACTKVFNETEHLQKQGFLNKNYHIKKDHIYLVYHNNDKLKIIDEIKKNYPGLEDKFFVMIDDTVEVLNNIMDNSNYSTVHISSFLN